MRTMRSWPAKRCEIEWPAQEEPAQRISIRRIPATRRGRTQFTIVTPSYRQSEWLKLCIASVADQGVALEHIVQDACSDDGTLDWLPRDPRVIPVVAGDEGIYDAINRGFRRARGDILACLNCEEQYFPGALKSVWEFFESHPKVEMVLGDTLVTKPDGSDVCERTALTPRWLHTRVGATLSYMTAGAFIRRRTFEDRELWFAPEMGPAGDREWTLRLIRSGVRVAVLGGLTTLHTETGRKPIGGLAAAQEQTEYLRNAPAWARALGPWVRLQHWLRHLARRAGSRPLGEYRIYTLDSPGQRRVFRADHQGQREKSDATGESRAAVEASSDADMASFGCHSKVLPRGQKA